MDPITLMALGLLAIGVLGRRKKLSPYKPIPGGGWADRDAPDRIRALAQEVIDVTGWYGLDDFLVAVAWRESRGNSRACPDDDCSGNRARGWFQGRPNSFLVGEYKGANPDLLFDEKWAVALAAWYAWRIRRRAYEGQEIDWLALRRGWRLPKLVSDVDEEEEDSPYVRGHFEDALIAVGLDDTFMYEPAFPKGMDWPGIDVVLKAVGAK